MKVSGFTFVRNAISNGYPLRESILSLLPIVDEYVIAIGDSDDTTEELIESINSPKIKVIQTTWNPRMQDRGFVYGQQKMIAQYSCSGDWLFYLEADEVLHENDLAVIYDKMVDFHLNERVEALYFEFLHFYGSPWHLGIAGYRKAPRIIKSSIRSIAPDGLFFIVLEQNKKGRYPIAADTGCPIYHYGHCRKISYTNKKLAEVGRFWGHSHLPRSGYENISKYEIKRFEGGHPLVMKDWLENSAEVEFEPDPNYRMSFRDHRNRLRFWLESKFDLEISKKHFKKYD
jgi:glycosyltransferase involved in cell wall biosynthesis